MNLIKYFKYLVLVPLILASCKNNNVSKISGTFSGVVNRMIHIEELTSGENGFSDSVVTDEKGSFKFRLPSKDKIPAFYNINADNYNITLLVSPGEHIKIKSLGNLSRNYIVEGSEGSTRVREVNQMMYSMGRTLDSLRRIHYLDENVTGATNNFIRDYTLLYIGLKQELIRFLVMNPNSMASIYALYQTMPLGGSVFSGPNDFLYYKMVADSLCIKYPDSPHVKLVEKEYRDLEAKRNAYFNEESQMAEYVVPYPEIELPDVFGNSRKLSSLEGKVILIDFWMPSQNGTIMLNAEMKELYNEYSDKGLEIYQVSLGASKAAWISAIHDQQLPWVSVRDSEGSNSAFAGKYNVTKLPANFLIGRDGEIIGRDIFGKELSAKIKQAL